MVPTIVVVIMMVMVVMVVVAVRVCTQTPAMKATARHMEPFFFVRLPPGGAEPTKLLRTPGGF